MLLCCLYRENQCLVSSGIEAIRFRVLSANFCKKKCKTLQRFSYERFECYIQLLFILHFFLQPLYCKILSFINSKWSYGILLPFYGSSSPVIMVAGDSLLSTGLDSYSRGQWFESQRCQSRIKRRRIINELFVSFFLESIHR